MHLCPQELQPLLQTLWEWQLWIKLWVMRHRPHRRSLTCVTIETRAKYWAADRGDD